MPGGQQKDKAVKHKRRAGADDDDEDDRQQENSDSEGELEDPMVQIKEELARDFSKLDPDQLKEVEETILECAEALGKEKRTADLLWTLGECKNILKYLGKAKASYLMRTLLDYCLKTEEMKDKKIQLCSDCIAWAEAQNRTFLRRALQSRLIRLRNETGQYTIALELAGKLINEVKKLEDRDLLVEIVLEESKAAFALNNVAKARTSLVMAKTVANSAYMTPQLQAAIDLQSGVLSGEDGDFRTGFSYFYEAFENYEPLKGYKEEVIRSLKYMCLSKIMLDESEQITLLLTGKRAAYQSIHLEAMKALAKAFEKRSLTMFHEICAKYATELKGDVVIGRHSLRLYEKMLEKEMIRVVEPYDEVDLQHIVKSVGLPLEKIERSVAALILDRKIKGVLDQSAGTLTLYRPSPSEVPYKKALNLIRSLEKIVDTQYSAPRG